MKKSYIDRKGFTLIELLVVIAIIAALAVVIFVALNPIKRLADSRDSRRTADVETILTSIHEYVVDNKGVYPSGMSVGMPETQLGTGVSGCAVATSGCAATPSACLNLSTTLAKYLKSIPTDPKLGTTSQTLYTATADTNGIVTVRACGAENVATISQSR